jgi:hypothetical protein
MGLRSNDESIEHDKLPEPKSKGHVCFDLDRIFEFIHYETDEGILLYRAPLDRPIGPDGYRQGARFECMPRPDGHRAYLRNAWGVVLDQPQ